MTFETTTINGVLVGYDNQIKFEQVEQEAGAMANDYQGQGKQLKKILVMVDPDDEDQILLKPFPVIRRIRRICGYCVNMDNWNEAKLAELQQRKAHFAPCRNDS